MAVSKEDLPTLPNYYLRSYIELPLPDPSKLVHLSLCPMAGRAGGTSKQSKSRQRTKGNSCEAGTVSTETKPLQEAGDICRDKTILYMSVCKPVGDVLDVTDVCDAVGERVRIQRFPVRDLLLQNTDDGFIDTGLHVAEDLAPVFPGGLNCLLVFFVGDVHIGKFPVEVYIRVAGPEADWSADDVEVILAEAAGRLAGADVLPILEETAGLRAALGPLEPVEQQHLGVHHRLYLFLPP